MKTVRQQTSLTKTVGKTTEQCATMLLAIRVMDMGLN
jgi:hypothetical protein